MRLSKLGTSYPTHGLNIPELPIAQTVSNTILVLLIIEKMPKKEKCIADINISPCLVSKLHFQYNKTIKRFCALMTFYNVFYSKSPFSCVSGFFYH